MTSQYTALKDLIGEVTGFELPDHIPEIGKQYDTAIPNPDVYKTANRGAYFVYFGDGNLLLHSRVTGEQYRFDGIEKDYADFEKKARGWRKQEEKILCKKLYQNADKVDLKGHPVASKWNVDDLIQMGVVSHEDFAPDGISFGELRCHDDDLVQAFWAFEKEDGRYRVESGHANLVAVRMHGANGIHDPFSTEDIEPCLHIHQMVFQSEPTLPFKRYATERPGTPVFWTCGIENALRARRDYPDFTIVEAFNVEHLNSLVDRKLFGNGDEYVGLSSNDLRAFMSTYRVHPREAMRCTGGVTVVPMRAA
ncbi:hypothetical protein QCB44_03105 [Thiomicrorhabdus sp. zzn3]|uniref:hypothetical protein n=1 Tax=Thiomicrorhabdus sp. zzn3 TaxID=3039775 RepID=UPI002436FF71|nr:hypothetical protein [Thiomicrorhabdus sp. zzn3]MDG6777688.1 hypothetical protein [Thiomicrorhabdus sp. zzn3]